MNRASSGPPGPIFSVQDGLISYVARRSGRSDEQRPNGPGVALSDVRHSCLPGISAVSEAETRVLDVHARFQVRTVEAALAAALAMGIRLVYLVRLTRGTSIAGLNALCCGGLESFQDSRAP